MRILKEPLHPAFRIAPLVLSGVFMAFQLATCVGGCVESPSTMALEMAATNSYVVPREFNVGCTWPQSRIGYLAPGWKFGCEAAKWLNEPVRHKPTP